ncbi:MAG TPA: DinB family protein [Chryseosolibacter sp.]
METMTKPTTKAAAISTDILLNQWLGHRKVTRRLIEVFPEDKLFTYSIGGMRTFAELAAEILALGAPGIRGVVEGKWDAYEEIEARFKFKTKKELLAFYDQGTEEIKALWPQISAERFFEVDKFLGLYESPIYWSILYCIDNEIHHRGQAYVYLRSLGIEPPAFWNRN